MVLHSGCRPVRLDVHNRKASGVRNETATSRLTFFLPGSPRAATVAKYWMTRFVLTVLPAPDSPLKEGRR